MTQPKHKAVEIEIKQIIKEQITTYGLEMSKCISPGGLFMSPNYDTRKVYSLEEISKLSKQGFSVSEDLGVLLFNAFMVRSNRE